MLDSVLAASPAEAPVKPVESKSDGKKSGNVTGEQARARLLQREIKPAESTVKKPGDSASLLGLQPEGAIPPGAEAATPERAANEPNPAVPVSAEIPSTEPKPEQDQELETQPDLSQFSNLDPRTQTLVKQLLEDQKKRTQEAIDRRIGKEVAKRKDLEDRLAAVQPQVPANGLMTPPVAAPQLPPQAPAQRIQPMPQSVPLAEVADVKGLHDKQAEAREFRRKADMAIAMGPDSGGKYVITDSSGNHELSKEQVIQLKSNAEDMLEVQIPARFQFFQQRQAALQFAYTEFPWLKNQSAPEYQQAMSILNQVPWLRNLPNAEVVLGIQVEGLKAIEARKKAAEKPAAPASDKPKPPGDQAAHGASAGGGGRLPDSARARQSLTDEIGKLSRKGGVNSRDVASYLSRKDQLSQSR